MKVEVVSLTAGEKRGLYHAVLRVHDSRDTAAVQQAFERSIRSLNTMESIRMNVDLAHNRAARLLAKTQRAEGQNITA